MTLAGRITTYSGNLFNILDPAPDDFRIEDIAHSLSLKCRYNGMCKAFYSVAQHSVYASYMTADNDLKKALLLHDGTEAYIDDLVRPLKVLFPDYIALEHALGNKLAVSFGLAVGAFETPELKSIDMRLMVLEATVMVTNPDTIFAWTGRPDASIYSVDPSFTFWTPIVAEKMFLQRFYELRTEESGS